MSNRNELVILKSTWDAGVTDCELCGVNYNEGTDWKINGTVVWYESRTGCFGGSQSEQSLLEGIFDYLLQHESKLKLFEWWHESTVPKDELSRIKKCFDELGIHEDITLVKMIALYLKNTFSLEVTIDMEHVYENVDDEDEHSEFR